MWTARRRDAGGASSVPYTPVVLAHRRILRRRFTSCLQSPSFHLCPSTATFAATYNSARSLRLSTRTAPTRKRKQQPSACFRAFSTYFRLTHIRQHGPREFYSITILRTLQRHGGHRHLIDGQDAKALSMQAQRSAALTSRTRTSDGDSRSSSVCSASSPSLRAVSLRGWVS